MADNPDRFAEFGNRELLVLREGLSERARMLNRLLRDGDESTAATFKPLRDEVETLESEANDSLGLRSVTVAECLGPALA